MAFNPFHTFRKYQRPMFAVLTIVAMLSFIGVGAVSMGGGDLFSEMTRWFGGRGRGASDVGRLYGSRVSFQQIRLLRWQRQAANYYMTNAVNYAHNNLFGKVFDALAYSKEQRERAGQMLGFYRQFAAQGFGLQQYAQTIRGYESQLELKRRETKSTSESDRLSKLIADLEVANAQFEWLLHSPKDPLYPTANLYFGGSTSVEGLLDFMIWQRQADRLGIELTDDDVIKAIKNETLNNLTAEIDEAILKSMSREFINDAGSVRHALREEFRVRLAQAALSGYDPGGIQQSAAAVTPYELWQYYVKNRTEVSVEMLPLPVSKFVSQVKEKPTTDDLRKLYERYKDEEPVPDRDAPGFKQPRQIKVEWIDFSRDDPAIRAEARDLLLSQAAASVSNPLLAAGWGVSLLKAYENAARPQFTRQWGDPEINRLNEPGFPLDLYIYKDLQRPDTLASVLGLAANGNALNAALSVPGRAAARETTEMAPLIKAETQRRVPVAAAFVGAATSLPAGLAVADTLLAAGKNEEFVPPALMNRQLVKSVEDKLAETIAKNSETAFKEGLEKVRRETSRQKGKFEAAAAEYIKKEIARHKWTHGGSTRLDSSYDIAQDEGLKPLKDAYLVNNFATDPKATKFGAQFFAPVDGKQESLKPYTPRPLDVMVSDKSFLFWITADNAPKVLPFAEVQKKVEDAWYLKEARPLAAKAAEDLAQKARKSGTPVPELVEAAQGQELIELHGVARLTGKSARAGAATPYQEYQFPPDKIEYPSTDFLDKILELKQVNDVTVLVNKPKNVYYVAAIIHRNEPSPTGDEFRQGDLLPRIEASRQRMYRLKLMEQLRADAHLQVDPEGRKQAEEKGESTQQE